MKSSLQAWEHGNNPCRVGDGAAGGEWELGFGVRSKFRLQFKLCDQEEISSLALSFPIGKMGVKNNGLTLGNGEMPSVNGLHNMYTLQCLAYSTCSPSTAPAFTVSIVKDRGRRLTEEGARFSWEER